MASMLVADAILAVLKAEAFDPMTLGAAFVSVLLPMSRTCSCNITSRAYIQEPENQCSKVT